ncbi:hypothetical protein CRV08_14355 [Halarcobacter ebronensis]|uniref:Uncharacterized protein n=1 Tax=Halarcobacter ebronensis TaxID=1462615 RepID=A0A4Q0Y6H9_9BACT|nr:hypothetical protein [Halarcobacter ebronensis]RXJ65777.1 hypothetical protein CRV08_14355 [Halarcobacter ebronensis]
MKVIYLVLSEGSELEFVGSDENYNFLRNEYLNYMVDEEQKVFSFPFPNNGELLVNFDEVVAIYAEEDTEEFDDEDDE